jgi:hypothetical protein
MGEERKVGEPPSCRHCELRFEDWKVVEGFQVGWCSVWLLIDNEEQGKARKGPGWIILN